MTGSHVVYIIGAEESRLVKIGTTDDLNRRLREIQNMCPVTLTVLWQTPGGEKLERALHRRFKPWRRHGEWFDLSNPVESVQEALRDPTLLSNPVRKTPFKSARKPASSTRAARIPEGAWKPPQQLTGRAERVHRALRERIEEGEFLPGSPLPRPRELATEYDVPVITAASAVKCLEAHGLVAWPRGQSAVVLEP